MSFANIHKFRFYSLFALLTAALYCKAEIYTATGSAQIRNGNEDEARKLALENAQQLIVSDIFDEFLVSRVDKTSLERLSGFNFAEFQEICFSRLLTDLPPPTVHSASTMANGLYRARISTDLDVNQFTHLLLSGLLEEQYARFIKRPAIRLDIRINTSGDFSQKGSGDAFREALVGSLAEQFLANDFEVLDESISSMQPPGFTVQADLSITSSENRRLGVSYMSNTLSGTVLLSRPGNSTALASLAINTALQDMPYPDMARKIARENIYPEISTTVVAKWLQSIASPTDLTVAINGANAPFLSGEISQLFSKMLLGVQQITVSTVSDNAVQFQVKYLGWQEQLQEEIAELLKLNKFTGLSIHGYEGDKLVLQLN
jgi:hypothetical protein